MGPTFGSAVSRALGQGSYLNAQKHDTPQQVLPCGICSFYLSFGIYMVYIPCIYERSITIFYHFTMHPWPYCNGRTRNAVSMSMSMSIYTFILAYNVYQAQPQSLLSFYLLLTILPQHIQRLCSFYNCNRRVTNISMMMTMKENGATQRRGIGVDAHLPVFGR